MPISAIFTVYKHQALVALVVSVNGLSTLQIEKINSSLSVAHVIY